jgi:thiosulfate dehydrogenase [quinone] large subunit
MKSKQFALLRIAFGVIWAIDAWFKWQPAFFSGFVGYFTAAAESQPAAIVTWINWWVQIVSPHPEAWALFIACAQTLLAIALIFGLFTRAAIICGIVLSFLIWAVPEGFGMLFMPGMTDPGAAIIYVLLFIALWIGESWRAYSLDSFFAPGRSSESA